MMTVVSLREAKLNSQVQWSSPQQSTGHHRTKTVGTVGDLREGAFAAARTA